MMILMTESPAAADSPRSFQYHNIILFCVFKAAVFQVVSIPKFVMHSSFPPSSYMPRLLWPLRFHYVKKIK
jgi:hypothetical protein